ncbi:MAG TPA: DUF4309 domain-containing protein [Tissierellia bacterium]|nr:DUF4309 domain-containing protein [Tissierellia bacterium]
MKEKNIKLGLILLGLVILSAFIFINREDKKGKINEPHDNPLYNEEVNNEPIVNEDEDKYNSSDNPADDERANELFRSAYDGYIDNVEFGIGDDAGKVVEKWGEPNSKGYIYGGLYLQYDKAIFYTNGYIEDDNYIYGNISMIDTGETYGIKEGMIIEEAIELLGIPDGEDIYDELRDYGEGIYYPKFYYYAGDYTISIVYDPETKLIKYIQLDDYRPEPDIGREGFAGLNEREKEVYEDFTIGFDENVLNGMSPLSVMKIYIHALMEGNYEAEWELYTKEEDQLGWDKEYHMAIPEEDRPKNFDHYRNPVNIKLTYSEDYKYASISWEDRYLDEYDGFGNPFRYSFSLVRSEDYIWKVSFLPMQ